jgi:hypothetical protein
LWPAYWARQVFIIFSFNFLYFLKKTNKQWDVKILPEVIPGRVSPPYYQQYHATAPCFCLLIYISCFRSETSVNSGFYYQGYPVTNRHWLNLLLKCLLGVSILSFGISNRRIYTKGNRRAWKQTVFWMLFFCTKWPRKCSFVECRMA